MNSPDNLALTRRRAASGKMPFLLLCDKEILYHGFLCFSAIAVTVTQATMLNFFIIAFFRGYYHQVATYFWFLGDLFIVCLLALSFTTAYRYIHLRRKLEDARLYTEQQIQQKIQRSIYKHVMWLSPKHCGTLPFCFITWFTYSGFLVAKLCLILSSEIPAVMIRHSSNTTDPWPESLRIQADDNLNDPIHSLDSNLLKLSVGLSALVFIIMLQAHHNHDPDSPHSGYIMGVCHNIAVEVFDSVTLLSLLFVTTGSQELNLSIWKFDKLIIVLSSINLVLPTITLYSLSMSNFGRHLDCVIRIKVFTQLIQLFVINIPFLGVRIFLWANMKYPLSLFMVKNLCYIFVLIHSLYPGLVYIVSNLNCKKQRSLVEKEDDDIPTSSQLQLNNANNQDIELNLMKSQNSPPRNLNRVSKAAESGDEISP